MEIKKLIILLLLGLTSVTYANADNQKPSIDDSLILEEKKLNIQDSFTPSGWMGDQSIEFDGAYRTNSHTKPDSIKITYTFGSTKWAGIYWQNKPNNWGNKPGNDYSKKRFKKISFWAKGENGNEIVEFKAGGISNPEKQYSDSFEVTTGKEKLSTDWKKYEMDIKDSNLSSVIGGFCWVASKDFNSQKDEITFYIDDIIYE